MSSRFFNRLQSTMGKGQYERRQGLKRNRATKAETKYKQAMSSMKRTATVSYKQKNVAGANQTMSNALFPPKQEVKTKDLLIALATTTGDWTQILQGAVATITQGSGSDQRIGRNIRVVGLVFRAVTKTDPPQTNAASPFTIDMIWDTQPPGTAPPFTEIYTSVAHEALPNATFNQRFKWQKRYEFNSSNSNTPYHTVNMESGKINKLVTYSANTGLIGDVEKNNLVFCWSGIDDTASLDGILRILYVDA